MWEEFGVGKHWQFWQTERFSLMFYLPILSFIATYTHNSFICNLPSKWFSLTYSLNVSPHQNFPTYSIIQGLVILLWWTMYMYLTMPQHLHVKYLSYYSGPLLKVFEYLNWLWNEMISSYPLHYKSAKTVHVGDKVRKTRQQLNRCVDIYAPYLN